VLVVGLRAEAEVGGSDLMPPERETQEPERHDDMVTTSAVQESIGQVPAAERTGRSASRLQTRAAAASVAMVTVAACPASRCDGRHALV